VPFWLKAGGFVGTDEGKHAFGGWLGQVRLG